MINIKGFHEYILLAKRNRRRNFQDSFWVKPFLFFPLFDFILDFSRFDLTD